MNLASAINHVKNDRIQFVTMKPEGSVFATLDRRVVVTGPRELTELCQTGETQALDELVELLTDPERAWAAEVLLATMTRREEKLVESYAANPSDWWDVVGATAHERWSEWLDKVRDRLEWDAASKTFVEKS